MRSTPHRNPPRSATRTFPKGPRRARPSCMTAFHPTQQAASNTFTCDHLEMGTLLRILAIPGSLRARSSNLLLLETAALLTPAGIRLEIFAELGNIPLFNPDRTDVPPAVVALRSSIQDADAVIVSAPEYA